MTQHLDTAATRQAAIADGDPRLAGTYARHRHWRMFAGVAVASITLAWLSLPGQPSQHEINVRLATFAFRV
jgi:hypothetical protein